VKPLGDAALVLDGASIFVASILPPLAILI